MKKIALIVLSFFTLLSCKKKESNYSLEISQIKHSYLASFEYLSNQHKAEYDLLCNRLESFGNLPIIGNFNFCRTSWNSSYNSFNKLRPFLYMQGTIDNPFHYNVHVHDFAEFDISYIDYTSSNANSGLISNTAGFPVINAQTVRAANQNSMTNYTLGYHVVEFLLWGEDNNPNGPGQRQHFDYVSTSSINDRRADFLQAVAVNLRADLDQNYYSNSFKTKIENLNGKDFLSFYINGLVAFTENELGARFLLKPFESQSIDSELSRFADNSLAEIQSMSAMLNWMILGETQFDLDSDYYLGDLFGKVNPESYNLLKTNLESLSDLLNSFTGNFDNAIVGPERSKIKQAYDYVQEISSLLRGIGSELGLSLY